MRYSISGEIAQSIRLEFEPGEFAWCSKGSLMAYTPSIQWNLRVPGGLGGAVRRSLSGEGIALTYLQTDTPEQHALLSANAPGHLEVWDLESDGPVTTTRGSFLCAWGDDLDITVTIARRAGAALFGGAGLFLQTVSGKGTVLVHASGDFSEHRLVAGEQMLVSTGNLAAFSSEVDYDIQGVGGCRKILFSGEGLFMTRLSGPGRVLLQTLKRQFGANSANAA
ncbi:MAG: AIM24 family protein [Caldilineaceae bacterium]|nr:AIM24 family protein [Caldilineaceae bacterium]HRJ42974.1 AIM24 family protein [Caldilineaceae bacterium]